MTIKIQLISDTHTQEYSISNEADLVVHLGDAGNGKIKYILEFVNKCKEAGKDYIFVPGNHDAYNWSIEGLYEWLASQNINYLAEGKEFKFGNYTFVGGTLFSNFQLYSTESWEIDKYKLEAQANISDFYCVEYKRKLVTPNDYITFFNNQYNFINQYRNKENVIVLTHFLPSIDCVDEYWLNHTTSWKINAYFASNINLKGFKNWWFGHTHSAVDKVVDGCRLLCNPMGYMSEKSQFQVNKIITLD